MVQFGIKVLNHHNMVAENGKHDLHLKSLRKLNEILHKLKMQGLLEEFGWWIWATSREIFGPPNSWAYFSRCEMLGVSSFAKNFSPWIRNEMMKIPERKFLNIWENPWPVPHPWFSCTENLNLGTNNKLGWDTNPSSLQHLGGYPILTRAFLRSLIFESVSLIRKKGGVPERFIKMSY